MDGRNWKVGVVGGGVIGLTTAHLVRDLTVGTKPVDVTIISEQFSPHVTTNVAAGFWEPGYSVGSPDQEALVKKWAVSTWDHIVRLNNSPEGGEAGTCLLFGYHLTEEPGHHHLTNYTDSFFNFRDMNEKELAMFPPWRYGSSYVTVMANPTRYMPWLTEKLRKRNVKFIKRKVKRLEELAGDYDVIVNCAGVGAAMLNDDRVQPGRGQIIKVHAPWVKQFVIADQKNGVHYYILPCPDFVVLGGTNQKGDWKLDVSQEDKKRIWEECCKLLPNLRGAKILEDKVGLRPLRDRIRIETEQLATPHGKKWLVHNYGHGGSGITCHWGSGEEAVGLVKECLEKLALQSKL